QIERISDHFFGSVVPATAHHIVLNSCHPTKCSAQKVNGEVSVRPSSPILCSYSTSPTCLVSLVAQWSLRSSESSRFALVSNLPPAAIFPLASSLTAASELHRRFSHHLGIPTGSTLLVHAMHRNSNTWENGILLQDCL